MLALHMSVAWSWASAGNGSHNLATLHLLAFCPTPWFSRQRARHEQCWHSMRTQETYQQTMQTIWNAFEHSICEQQLTAVAVAESG